MNDSSPSLQPKSKKARRGIWVLLGLLILGSLPIQSATVSRKYKFEKNKAMGLELATADIQAQKIVFEFPSSMLRFQSANKAKVWVTNGGQTKARIGLAIALFDSEGDLVGAGTGGNKGGRVAPGETAEFSVFFYYLSERIDEARSFHISMETN